jgi:hypothetical protein
MTSVSRSGVFIGRKAHWKEPRVGSSLCVTDFLSTRGRRVAEADDNNYQLDSEYEIIRRSAAERRHRAEILGPVERFAYSLISAAALTVVLMGILALGNSSRQAGAGQSIQFGHEIIGTAAETYAGESDARQTRPN